ncbi:MAG TPA: HlyD family efflux transporter periplasmic adaptor subunit, partial [Gemmatimonadaceae bacterium]|nr:HlyD family efflux transporter periplasmic adaptor subunit [Gemmatimonadaceae bacterium]
FQPAFYCNVNDAWSFPSLRARVWVTAAGSWIQLVIASLAAIVWAVARPGTLVSEIAVATMLVGGATTIVTNANPLLPLDGYFVLTDWLEIPNLRLRAKAYFGWWVRRRVLRLELPEPTVTDRERRVFLIYGALAAVYISVFLGLIGAWLIGRAHQALGMIGALLTLAVILTMARRPVLDWGRSMVLAWRARRAERTGRRGWRTPVLVTLGVVALLAVVPWTMTTAGKFTVAPRREQRVTAPDSGVIAQVLVQEGMHVAAGAPVARIIDRSLERELLRAVRTVDSLSVAVARARAASTNAVTARLEAERVEAVAKVASVQTRVDALTLRAQWAGVVTTPRVRELEGLRVFPGDEVMRLAMLDSLEARVALSNAGALSVHTGQVVHLIAHGDAADLVSAAVGAVAPAGAGSERSGTIEVRVPVGRDVAWRAGATGEASVEIRRSTMLAALWWAVRQRIRGDVFL